MSYLRDLRVLVTVVLVLAMAIALVLVGPDLVKAADRLTPGDPWVITTSAGPGGSIGPSDDVPVIESADQTFSIFPNAGYEIADVLVDGTSEGAAASDTFTNVTADRTISARFATGPYTDMYSLTYSAGAGGSLIGDTSQFVADGEDGTPVTADPDTGYRFTGWSDGVMTATRIDTNVTADLAVSASFARLTYTIIASAAAHGTISPAGAVSVDYGASQVFTITPATGYHVDDVRVDGVSVGSRTSYPFSNVTADHTISATFAINSYTIIASAAAHGTISPAGAVSVDYGASQAFTITPATGYHVDDVLVDGVSVGPVSVYTFSDVTAGHTISATFAINSYTIIASAAAHGTISPAGAVSVDYGASQAFTITPATGYYVDDVLVDGVSVGPVPGYTFSDVTADHTISATFAAGVQTRIEVSAGKAVVDYGSSTVLSGVLWDSGDPLGEVGMGGRSITVQSASSTAGPWVDLETLTTSAVLASEGTFSLTVTPTSPSYYRVRFVAEEGSDYGDSLSYIVRVGVRPLLGVPKVPSSAVSRRSFTVYGTLRPQFPAGERTVKVKVYRYKNRRWVFVKRVSATNADSGSRTRYAVKVKLVTKGRYRFRAYTVATATWAGDTTRLSTVLTIR